MDSLHFNQLKKIKIALIMMCLSAHLSVSGQNPFDIKTPGNKPKTTEPTQVQEKPVTPAQAPIPQDPPKAQPSAPSNTTTQPSTTPVLPPKATTSTSTNVFDIKAGPNSKVIHTNHLPASNSATVQSPSQDSKKDTSAALHSSKTNPASGLQDVTNPFSSKPSKDGSTSPNTSSDPTHAVNNAEPNLNELKSNLSHFKDATIKEEGSISKNVWFVIYIFLFLLAAVAINFNRSYPMALIKATYNQNQLRILFKDAFKGNHVLVFSILYLLFIINGGIFLYQSIRIFDLGQISLLLAIGLVLTIYLLRHLVLFIMGLAFPLTREALLFSYTIGIHNLALGLALMLINILLSFVDPETGKMLIFSGLTIVLVMYLLRQVRGLLNNMPLILSDKFHFIIYLCTVEIAPWLLLTGILLH